MKEKLIIIGCALMLNVVPVKADENENFKAQREHLQQDRSKLHEKIEERKKLNDEIKTLRKEVQSERKALKDKRRECIKKHREQRKAEKLKCEEAREQFKAQFQERTQDTRTTSNTIQTEK